jgi:ferredoxin
MIKKVILAFPAETTEQPIIYNLIKQFDVQFNILKASIEVGKSGKLFLEFSADNDKIENAFSYLEKNGVKISPIESKISFDSNKCINCGNCASACISQALSLKAPDWKIKFDPDKCVLCKLCLKSCPLRLFEIEFSE